MRGRNTIQKELVMKAVSELANHPTAEEVYALVSKDNPTVSKATVYRNLKQLSLAGSLRRLEKINFADRYDHNTHDHYHFQCSECGKVFDVEMDFDDDIMNRVKKKKGFTFSDHEIIFKGLCPECGK